MTAPAAPFEALVAITWSRVWSPVVPPALFVAAWAALGLPEDRAVRDTAFFSTFHAGFPTPKAPLLLHAALNRPGDAVRMDVLRAMSHLGVKAGDHMLPPDHVAIACEVLTSAIVAGEPVIVREIAMRYLVPWCERMLARLEKAEAGLMDIVRAFRDFLYDVQDDPTLFRAAAE